VQEEEGQEEGLQEEAEEAGRLMRRMTLAGGFALAASTFALIAAPGAGATTYNNDTPIIIPTQGSASPYPSSITVSGTAGPLTDVNVGLDGLVHTKPDDVAIVLVAPGGQALLLADCAGGDTDALGVFLTFDDAAAVGLPNTGQLSTGTFDPTLHCFQGATFPAPGPQTYERPGPIDGNTATLASAFNGQSAIGTWNLFVIDHFPGNGGSIPGGWSLDVKPDVMPLPAATPTQTLAPATPTAPAKKKCKKKRGKKGCKKKPKRSS
jgi:subtilisin-like proprotein convertase family protein